MGRVRYQGVVYGSGVDVPIDTPAQVAGKENSAPAPTSAPSTTAVATRTPARKPRKVEDIVDDARDDDAANRPNMQADAKAATKKAAKSSRPQAVRKTVSSTSKTARQTTSKPKRKATLEVQQKKAKASPSKVKLQCELCGSEVYATAYDLQRHMRTHVFSFQQLHQCKQCPYTAVQPGNLTAHMQQHKPETILQCGVVFDRQADGTVWVCNKTFTQLPKLASHRLSVHGDRDASSLELLPRQAGPGKADAASMPDVTYLDAGEYLAIHGRLPPMGIRPGKHISPIGHPGKEIDKLIEGMNAKRDGKKVVRKRKAKTVASRRKAKKAAVDIDEAEADVDIDEVEADVDIDESEAVEDSDEEADEEVDYDAMDVSPDDFEDSDEDDFEGDEDADEYVHRSRPVRSGTQRTTRAATKAQQVVPAPSATKAQRAAPAPSVKQVAPAPAVPEAVEPAQDTRPSPSGVNKNAISFLLNGDPSPPAAAHEDMSAVNFGTLERQSSPSTSLSASAASSSFKAALDPPRYTMRGNVKVPYSRATATREATYAQPSSSRGQLASDRPTAPLEAAYVETSPSRDQVAYRRPVAPLPAAYAEPSASPQRHYAPSHTQYRNWHESPAVEVPRMYGVSANGHNYQFDPEESYRYASTSSSMQADYGVAAGRGRDSRGVDDGRAEYTSRSYGYDHSGSFGYPSRSYATSGTSSRDHTTTSAARFPSSYDVSMEYNERSISASASSYAPYPAHSPYAHQSNPRSTVQAHSNVEPSHAWPSVDPAPYHSSARLTASSVSSGYGHRSEVYRQESRYDDNYGYSDARTSHAQQPLHAQPSSSSRLGPYGW